mgnify:FL=1
MQGKKRYSEKLFVHFQLSDRVPEDNFYRQLDNALNLKFLYQATASFYGDEGQQSIDPVVFFKLMMVGYFENLSSDRRIITTASMRLDILYFIGYDIDEPLPWHSTLSRTRQLYGEEIFLQLFQKVLSLCVQQGMVRGKRQAIDSAFIKANASLDSLLEKEIVDDAADYIESLENESDDKQKNDIDEKPANENQTVKASTKKWVDKHHAWKEKEYKNQPGKGNITGQTNKINNLDEHGDIIRPKFLSNHTHYSPTDPDARISVKPGKARQLNYFGQLAVDDAHHVITGAMANFADKRDSQCLPAILDQAINNLAQNNITIAEIGADSAYSSGLALAHAEQNNITAYIPNFGQYRNSREGFIYNKEQDQYECQRGNKAILPFKGIRTDSKGYDKKIYRSSETDCKNCPLRKSCAGEKTKFKKLDDTVDKPYYDRMHERMQTEYAKTMVRIRSKTVEPVLGTLLNFMGMRRVNTRGIKQANKHVLMASLCYNLKKYLKFIRQNPVANKNYKLIQGKQLPNYISRLFYMHFKRISSMQILVN